jgi:TonB family protein
MRLLSPFPLDHTRALPVTGEFHPLRREFSRWMSSANMITMLLVLTGMCAYLALKREPVEIHLPPRPEIVIGPPPVIDPGQKKGVEVVPEISPKLGSIEPVQDTNPNVTTYPTVDDFAKAIGSIDPVAIGDGDLIVVSDPEPLPGPTEFVAYEQPPDLLRMQAPVYPPLAREANIEGTVLLRVLVSKEGKVLNTIVLSGNPILAEAARTAAFTALFKPALQQHKPVSVWVQLPVVFSLK